MEKNMECEIINWLFHSNLDEVLQTIFLQLDPVSLKTARCVCHQWNQFILERLWGSKPARNRLQARLNHRWITRPSVEIVDLFKTERTIYFLTCDDKFVYSGTGEGFAEVHSLATGERVLELDCRSEENQEEEELGEFVQLDVGREVLATAYKYNVCIWLKSSGERVYQGKHHGNQSVFGVKVTESGKVVTGAGDGSVFVLQPDVQNRWEVVHKLTEVKEEISHIDTDGDWMMAGTSKSVHLWDLSVPGSVKYKGMLGIQTYKFILSFPFLLVVGGHEWTGLQVWNIKTRKRIRLINMGKRHFNNIHYNGRFIAVSEMVDNYDHVEDDEQEGFVFVFDPRELVDSVRGNFGLWRKARISESENYLLVNGAVNQTSLVVSQTNSVSLQNFWDGATSYLPQHDTELFYTEDNL